MNKICLFVEIDEEPTDPDKQAIESLLESVILEINPTAEMTIETGSGSWIIFVCSSLEKLSGWLIPEFGSWLVGKGLDWVQNRISHPIQLSIEQDKESSLTPEQKEHPLGRGNSSEIIKSSQADNENEILLNLVSQMANMIEHPAFSQSKKVTFKIGEWSSSRNFGISASLTRLKDEKNETELEFAVDLTDSKEDFNSRFNF